MITIPTLPPSGTFGAFKSQAPKEKPYLLYLVVATIIIILGTSYYFLFYTDISFSLQKPALKAATPLNEIEIKVTKLKELPFNVIDNQFYKSLRSYGAVPVVADLLGRQNPFIPY